MSGPTRHLPGLLGAGLSALGLLVGTPARADVQTGRIAIDYVMPENPAHEPLYRELKDKRALEKLQEIFSPLKLPFDVTLRTVGCRGQVNAWYYSQTVIVCYEYLEHARKNVPTAPTASITPSDAMIGQFFYVFAHEMGHATFDALNVPVFGGLEEAADKFATYVMLHFGKDEARRLVIGAAYAYKDSIVQPKVTVTLKAFSDAHGLPEQRYYNLLCIAYGADAQLFAGFVEKGYLPKTRASGCKREYGEVAYAFDRLILPHLDKDLAQKVMQKAWLPEPPARPLPN